MPEYIKGFFGSRTLFRAFAVLLVTLGSLHLLSGLADNMDFNRSITFFIDRPAGFSSLFPPPGSDEAHRLLLSSWHDKWVFAQGWLQRPALLTLSSYKAYVFVQSLFVRLIDCGSGRYSLIIGSLISRAIYFCAFIALFMRLRRAEHLLTTWMFMLIAAVLALSADFSAYFNTFFEDQLVIVFLPLIALCIYRSERDPQPARAPRWCALLLATFVGAAKTAFFPLPLIVAPFVMPLFDARSARLKTAAVVMACVAATLLPVFSGAFKSINQYHAVYAGALSVLSPREIAGIERIGDKPVLRECVNVIAYAPDGPSCMERAHARYADVLRLALVKPMIVPRIAQAVFSTGNEIRIGYLGTKLEHGDNFFNLPVFSWWRDLYRERLNYVMLASLVVAFVLIAQYRGSARAGRLVLLKIASFLGLFGFVGYATSFGDGLADNTRHLIGASYALSLSAVFFVPGVLALLLRGRGAEPADAQEHA